MNMSWVFLLMAFLSVPAVAAKEQPKDTGAQSRACREEVKKYCGQVKPGEGRVARCIKENEKRFSPGCIAAMEKQHKQGAEKPADKFQVCRADMEKFCKGKQDGSGGVVRCLREHEKELSDGCRIGLQKHSASSERKSGKD